MGAIMVNGKDTDPIMAMDTAAATNTDTDMDTDLIIMVTNMDTIMGGITGIDMYRL